MMHVHLMFLSEWSEFSSATCFAGGGGDLYDSSRLDVVEMAPVTCHASFQPL